jgi:hypothetical protein
MLDEPKYWVSFIIGIFVVALGGIPILNGFGWIPFALPGFLVITSRILLWLVAAIGAYLIIDSFLCEDDTVMWISIFVAVVIFGIAAIQILNGMNIIPFGIPFLSMQVLRILFVIEGLGLIIAAFGDK